MPEVILEAFKAVKDAPEPLNKVADCVPVKVLPPDKLAFAFKAFCWTVDKGLLRSDVLSTFPRLICCLVTRWGLSVFVEWDNGE